MTKRKNIESSNSTIPSLIPYDWQIIHSCHSDTFQRCICGHNVKRLTYIYNKRTCEIMRVGTTCVKKYGITQHITNSLLYVVLHKYIVDEIDTISESHEDSYVFIEIESCLRTCIQEKYKEINDKIEKGKTTEESAHASSSVNYYDVVVPFRRLLTETCDLVMEYKCLSLKELLQEIEDNINLLDNNIKHCMIDEYENSSAASESASTTASSVDTLDTISEIDEETDIDDSIRPEIQAVIEDILQNVLVEPPIHPKIQAVLENILQNVLVEPPIADAVVEDNMTPMTQTTPTTQPFNENIHLTIQNETTSNTTIDSPLTPLSWCDGTSTCYCTVHYRLKNLEYNIQEFKKEVQLHVENVKKTEELYRTMMETYRPLLKSSSTESSSS